MTRNLRYHPWLHRLAVLVAAWTLLMIVAGGMVTSQKAGDSVPDWPLSYGSLLPPMVGNVFWEHGHRMVGMALGLLTFTLAIAVIRTEARPRVRLLGWLAFPAVCLQGALGGFRVKIVSSAWLQDLIFTHPTGQKVNDLLVPVAVVHTATAQSLFCLMVILAVVTSRRWLRIGRVPPTCLACGYNLTGRNDQPMVCPECGQASEFDAPFVSSMARKLRGIAIATLAIIFLQILLGAVRRHTDGTIVFHLIGAGLVLLHVGLLARRVFAGFANVPALVKPVIWMLMLTAIQVVLGVASWVLTYEAIVKSWDLPNIRGSAEAASAVLTAHLALGAGLFALCTVITMRSFHNVALPASGEALATDALPESEPLPA
ncbi:MAG: COX15/CtaA family protein [Phycisphaerales bacterium]|nr:COX15/CtaA family protein [Phycisphaerales bacterium]